MIKTNIITTLDDLVESDHNFQYAIQVLEEPMSSDEIKEAMDIIKEEYLRVFTGLSIAMCNDISEEEGE